jgi:hypothetical protein
MEVAVMVVTLVAGSWFGVWMGGRVVVVEEDVVLAML